MGLGGSPRLDPKIAQEVYGPVAHATLKFKLSPLPFISNEKPFGLLVVYI